MILMMEGSSGINTHLIQQQPDIFPNLHFAADVLVILDISCQTRFQVGLGFPYHIPAYSADVPTVFPRGTSFLPHPINFFLLFKIY